MRYRIGLYVLVGYCYSDIQELRYHPFRPCGSPRTAWIPCTRALAPNLHELSYGQNLGLGVDPITFVKLAMAELVCLWKAAPQGIGVFVIPDITPIHHAYRITTLGISVLSQQQPFTPSPGNLAGFRGWE